MNSNISTPGWSTNRKPMGDIYWDGVRKEIDARKNAETKAAVAKYRREHTTDRRICKECGEAFMGWGTVRTCDSCRFGVADDEFRLE